MDKTKEDILQVKSVKEVAVHFNSLARKEYQKTIQTQIFFQLFSKENNSH